MARTAEIVLTYEFRRRQTVTETEFLYDISKYKYVNLPVSKIDITAIFPHQHLAHRTMFFKTLSITLAAASAVQGVAVPRRSRQSACSHYTIIDTRGNGTPQGPSIGFRIMNADIRMQVSGGKWTKGTIRPRGLGSDSVLGSKWQNE